MDKIDIHKELVASAVFRNEIEASIDDPVVLREAMVRYELAYAAGSFAWKWIQAEMDKTMLMENATTIARGYLKQKAQNHEIRTLDPLTGLMNKIAFEEEVSEITEGFKRSSDTVKTHSMLIMDLDDFKKINDTIGHPLTDARCLLPVAEIIKQSIRRDDLAARWGGEEFAIFLKDADTEIAIEKSKELQDKINAIIPVDDDGLEMDRLGVCIGIAPFPQGADYDEILKEADAALLDAKLMPGKNSVKHSRADK